MPVAFLFEGAPSVTTTEKEATNFLHTLDFIKMVHNAAGGSDSVDNHFREAAASRLSIANNVITKRRVSFAMFMGVCFLFLHFAPDMSFKNRMQCKFCISGTPLCSIIDMKCFPEFRVLLFSNIFR